MIKLQRPLILASTSPRRRELLNKLELPFTVKTVQVKEHIPKNIKPRESALYLAKVKGDAHNYLAKKYIVITADTIVITNNIVLGKPLSNTEAKLMLRLLANNSHEVITGISIRTNNKVHSFDVSTKVTFGPLSNAEIEHYVNSTLASDKAGAYGVQDWIGLIGISNIEGSYYNVMGFPTLEVYACLKNYFLKPWHSICT